MRQSSRLIFNVAVTYGRMTLGFVVGLLLTRQLLAELGEIEFGLFMSVGAAWGLLALFMVALQSSGQRHLAHCVGIGDDDATKQTFSSLCAANGIIALAIMLVGLVVGELLLRIIDIPPGREIAARYVYYLALITLGCTTFLNPFAAALLASQRLLSISLFDLTTRIAQLVAAYFMSSYSGDRLIYWALAYSVIEIAIGVARGCYGAATTPWARFSLAGVTFSEIKQMVSFANWLLIATTLPRMRRQGTLLLFNYFYGNSVAAAQGVAMQLVNYQNQMSHAITQAINPVLTVQWARQDLERFRRLVLLYCKFSTLSSALLAVFLLVELKPLVHLWLEVVPPYTISITWWTLLLFLISRLSVGYAGAMQARGQMAGVVAFVQLPELLFLLPIVLYLATIHGEPWHVPAMFCIANSFLTLVVLPIYAGRQIGLPAKDWFTSTAVPLLAVLSLAIAATWSVRWMELPELTRLIVAGLVNTAMLGVGGWFLVLTAEDRKLLLELITSQKRKVHGRAT